MTADGAFDPEADQPALPSLADLSDDLFFTLQMSAERLALLRNLVNRAGEDGLHADELVREEARAARLTALFMTVHRLAPAEQKVRSLLKQLDL